MQATQRADAHAAPTPCPTVHLPPSWQMLEFLSDLHLQDQTPVGLETFRRYLRHSRADAIFILGDLFEVWVGDDVALAPGAHSGAQTAREVCSLLRDAAARRPIYMQVGNRDFLLGEAFWQTTHVQALADPCILELRANRLLISHGDAWCLADTAYQRFRRMVRSTPWQRDFLSKPLAERIAIAKHIRSESQQTKDRAGVSSYTDVDDSLAHSLASAHQAHYVIHGHTHLPAVHRWPDGRERWVLSDWELDNASERGDIVRVTAAPDQSILSLTRVPIDQLTS